MNYKRTWECWRSLCTLCIFFVLLLLVMALQRFSIIIQISWRQTFKIWLIFCNEIDCSKKMFNSSFCITISFYTSLPLIPNHNLPNDFLVCLKWNTNLSIDNYISNKWSVTWILITVVILMYKNANNVFLESFQVNTIKVFFVLYYKRQQ